MKKIFALLVLLLIPSLSSAATLSVSPTTQNVKVGDTFTVNINLDTQGASIEGVDVRYLNFNPSLLQVVDANASTAGTQITAGSLMPTTLINSANNTTGKIVFSQAVVGGVSYRGSGILASVSFMAIAAGTSGLTFNYTSALTTDSNVASHGADVLTGVVNGNYSITVPVPDTTPPTVSITAPLNNATISNTANIVSVASDNIGVVGVQWKLDGANIGTELNTAPYSGSWDTNGVSNGIHSLSAVARDAANNKATSTVSITVSNTVVDTGGGAPSGGNSTGGTGGTTGGTTGGGTTGGTTGATGAGGGGGGGGGSAGSSSGTAGNSGGSTGTTNTGAGTTPAKNAVSPTGVFTPTVPQKVFGAALQQLVAMFTKNLAPGMTDPDVKLLQQKLNSLGYTVSTKGAGSVGNETMYYGPATVKAVQRFQCAVIKICFGTITSNGYGVFGSSTRSAFNTAVGGVFASAPIATSTIQTPVARNTGIGYKFTRSLTIGSTGIDVKNLQILLNNQGFTVASMGVGSPGNETNYFGNLTKQALIRFQDAHRDQVLTPVNLSKGTGFFGPSTIKFVNGM